MLDRSTKVHKTSTICLTCQYGTKRAAPGSGALDPIKHIGGGDNLSVFETWYECLQGKEVDDLHAVLRYNMALQV